MSDILKDDPVVLGGGMYHCAISKGIAPTIVVYNFGALLKVEIWK